MTRRAPARTLGGRDPRSSGLDRRRSPGVRAGVAALLLLAGCGGGPVTTTTPGPATARAPAALTAPAGTTLVATATGPTLAVHEAPGGHPEQELANPTATGGPLALMVVATAPGWLEVSLPGRPNGSSGWVAQADVAVTSTPWRLVVTESAHRLDVLRNGSRVARHPVGVGRAATPTVHGTFFVTELIRPPDPAGAYGPYAFGLSAYSDTLTSFAGGPGQLGLHGTDEPARVGRDVSHGCLRVTNDVISQLARSIPLGTPVEIRA